MSTTWTLLIWTAQAIFDLCLLIVFACAAVVTVHMTAARADDGCNGRRADGRRRTDAMHRRVTDR